MKRKRPTNYRGVRSYKKTNKSISTLNSNKINNEFSSQNLLYKIKSRFILKKLFENIEKKKTLQITQFNKTLQDKLNIFLDDYKNISKIIIEIFPTQKSIISKSKDGNVFINFFKEESKHQYHIYFNDNKDEVKRNYFNDKDNI